jgi:hypothetical protein
MIGVSWAAFGDWRAACSGVRSQHVISIVVINCFTVGRPLWCRRAAVVLGLSESEL